MSRGKKKHPLERPAVWLTLGVVAYGGLNEGSWAAVPLAFLVGCLYELFVAPATCAVPGNDWPCRENTRGRLRACYRRDHQQRKRDAVWYYITGLRNPIARFRKVWGREELDRGRQVAGIASAPRPIAGAADTFARLTITLTAIGTVAAMISTVHDLLG